MAELNARDTKLVQYLNEALTKEKQLEQALQAHIEMTTLAPYRKRLQQHLTETKRHAREVERRVKKLGGKADGITGVVQEVAAKGAALAQGPVHLVRGTSEQEVLLKNARTEFKEEAEEIASYTAIQKLAESVGDTDTARLAKAILREEKRMAGFLEKLIPRLTKSVVQAEIPRGERHGARRRTTSRSTTSRRRAAAGSRSRSTGTRSAAKKRTTSARSGSAKKASSRSRSGSSRSRTATARSRSTSARKTTGRATTRRKTTSRSSR